MRNNTFAFATFIFLHLPGYLSFTSGTSCVVPCCFIVNSFDSNSYIDLFLLHAIDYMFCACHFNLCMYALSIGYFLHTCMNSSPSLFISAMDMSLILSSLVSSSSFEMSKAGLSWKLLYVLQSCENQKKSGKSPFIYS